MLAAGVAVERRNPLPPGRYWQDVFTPARERFDYWLKKNKDKVFVSHTEEFQPIGKLPGRVFYIFQIKEDTWWEGPGYPTIATQEVQHSDDTETSPNPELDAADRIKKWQEQVAQGALSGIGKVFSIGTILLFGAAGAGIFYLITKMKEKGN